MLSGSGTLVEGCCLEAGGHGRLEVCMGTETESQFPPIPVNTTHPHSLCPHPLLSRPHPVPTTSVPIPTGSH